LSFFVKIPYSNSLQFCSFICQVALAKLRSSSQAATCYYQSNRPKVEAFSFKCLAQGQNKRTCQPYISTLSLFNAKLQARSCKCRDKNLLVWRNQWIEPRSTEYKADALTNINSLFDSISSRQV